MGKAYHFSGHGRPHRTIGVSYYLIDGNFFHHMTDTQCSGIDTVETGAVSSSPYTTTPVNGKTPYINTSQRVAKMCVCSYAALTGKKSLMVNNEYSSGIGRYPATALSVLNNIVRPCSIVMSCAIGEQHIVSSAILRVNDE